MLLLSTSMAMAQFGDLDDIIRKAESGNSGNGVNGSTESPSNPQKPNKGNINMSFIDEALKDGFFLIKQEYRLEDINVPGSRYDREGHSNFGETVSFVLKLKNGLVTTNQVVAPWESDENFEDYKGGQYVPHISRSSYLYVGKKDWKVADKMLNPESMKSENIKKSQGLAYLTEEAPAEGFSIARGYGKKDVFIVWLSYRGEKDDASAQYTIRQMELDISKGKTCEVPMQSAPNDAICGIVVEPIYSVGHIELAILGVIDIDGQAQTNSDESEHTCKMILIRSLVSDGDADAKGDSDLTPSPNSDKNKNNGKS